MSVRKKILGLFPGQGSQQVGMGQELYNNFPTAREMFEAANDALGFSLSNICFNGPENELTLTKIVQPAILTVSTICFRLAQEILSEQYQVCAAAGHSLGEYSALVAAGSLDFVEAVKLVYKRGQYMQAAVPVGQGKMIAVIGKETAELEAACQEIDGVVELANINAPGQVVIAGAAKAVDQLVEKLSGTRIIELQVSAPFHCSLMSPAQEQLSADLTKLPIHEPSFPIYANFSARPACCETEIRNNLKAQVCGRVRWVECIENACAETNPDIAVEFGTGAVLTGLLKRINRNLPRANVASPADAEKLVGG